MSLALFPFHGGPRDGESHHVKDNDCPYVGVPTQPCGYDVYVANADHDPTAYEYAGWAIDLQHCVNLASKVRPR
jgi:hypothetical protein